MILTVKLLLTAAMLAYAIGYAARHRDNRLHRAAMPVALLLCAAIPVAVGVGMTRLGAAYRPAYWLVRALPSEGGVHGVLIAHAVIFACALAILITQAMTGWMRHPAHRTLFPYAAGFWLASYLGGMFLLA